MFAGVPTLADPPVRPPVTTGIPQLYVVPAGTTPFAPLAGVTVNTTPPHTGVVISVMAGLGFTVTVTINVDPAQLPDVGVTV